MLEFIGQLIFDLIFCWPGAGIRWIFLRKKKNFKQLSEDIFLNSAIGAGVIALIVGGIYSLI